VLRGVLDSSESWMERNLAERSVDKCSVSKLDRLDSTTSLFCCLYGGKGVRHY